MKYPYTENNLIENSHSYFFSKYLGSDFLKAWKANRKSVLAVLPDPKEVEWPEIKRSRNGAGKSIQTDQMLAQIFRSLKLGKIGSDEKKILGKLVKRFEVKKRIYSKYTSDVGIINDAEYRDLSLYLYSAAVFSKAFEVSQEWPYLNVFLKIVDTLISVASQLDPKEASELAFLISLELRLGGEVAATRSVSC
jgi:hypothetical protein